MHRFLKKSTDHEKLGLLSVIQDDRNVSIKIDTAVTGSHHDDTSEPLIQPTVGWRIAAPLAKYTQGENSQMEMPTDVTRAENSRKEQMQVVFYQSQMKRRCS